jgi:hypothetical protein
MMGWWSLEKRETFLARARAVSSTWREREASRRVQKQTNPANSLLKFTGPESSKQFEDSVRLVASSSRLTVSLSEFKLSYSSDSVLNFFDFFLDL